MSSKPVVLVLGGTGATGSVVIDALLERDRFVSRTQYLPHHLMNIL
jgi:uncharacterized protein YbjT (DUF2867 family)